MVNPDHCAFKRRWERFLCILNFHFLSAHSYFYSNLSFSESPSRDKLTPVSAMHHNGSKNEPGLGVPNKP